MIYEGLTPPPAALEHLFIPKYVLVEEDGEGHQVRAGQSASVPVHLSKHLL